MVEHLNKSALGTTTIFGFVCTVRLIVINQGKHVISSN